MSVLRKEIVQAGFEKLSYEVKNLICNGMGSKNGIDVPDTFWGLNMTPCGDKHDYGYHIGEISFEKFLADALFLWNMYASVERKSNWIMRPLRKRRARIYCKAVVFAGDDAYYLKSKMNTGNRPKFTGWNSWYKRWKYYRKIWLFFF